MLREDLHDLALVPEEGIGVKVFGRVEPEVQSLFSVTHTIHVNIGLDQVGFSGCVPKKLEIKLVVLWTV